MRIGLRVAARTSGGGEAFADLLREALVDARGCSEVITFAMGGRTDWGTSVSVSTPVNPIARRVRGGRDLARAVTDNPVDVLLMPGTEVNKVPGIPCVMWPLTVAPFEKEARVKLGRTYREKVKWQALRLAVTSAARHADAFVFSSYYARALYTASLSSVGAAPSTVITPGSTLKFNEFTGAREFVRPYLLFVSHMYSYKMIVEAVRGHAIACSRGVDLDLVIAGSPVDASYAGKIRDEIKRCGTHDRVHVIGPTVADRLTGLYLNAHAFLFSSISENAGSYALIDAFKTGLPVFASSSSSMPEACQNAARYFDPRDPHSLADQLVRAYGDTEKWNRMATLSSYRGLEINSWDQIAEELVAFLRSEILTDD